MAKLVETICIRTIILWVVFRFASSLWEACIMLKQVNDVSTDYFFLEMFFLSNNNVQDDGVRDILEGLINQVNEDKTGKGLSILILWNNRLTKKSSPYFSRIIVNITNIFRYIVFNCVINNTYFKMFLLHINVNY